MILNYQFLNSDKKYTVASHLSGNLLSGNRKELEKPKQKDSETH